MATTTTEENKQLVRHAVEQYNNKNYDIFDEEYAEDAVDHGPMGDKKGPEGAKEGLKMLHAAFPDLEITLDELIAEGDIVAIRSTHRGTHEGTFMGIEPTGEQFEVENMVFARIEDGKVVERWVQYDTFGLMQQLGAIDPPDV